MDAIVVIFWACCNLSRLTLGIVSKIYFIQIYIDNIIVLIYIAFTDVLGTTAKKGNKCEDSYALLINLGLSAPVLLGHVFFYLWQTIVLDIDKILSAIGIVFVVFEFILSGLAIMTFVTNKRNT